MGTMNERLAVLTTSFRALPAEQRQRLKAYAEAGLRWGTAETAFFDQGYG